LTIALDKRVAGEPRETTSGWSTAARLLPRRPYPGLRPFEKVEWPIFRGRDRLIQDILTILAENHLVSIIGPSGSGKSSLVKAGVLATLERRHGRMGVQWRTAEVRPGASPLWSMADGILRSLRPEKVKDGEVPEAEVARIRALIDISEDGLAVILREFELEESENFLLLVDQFEDIFRYRSDEDDAERARLIQLLLAVANDRPSGLHVVTTMRSEYLGDCARFVGLAETLNATHYLVPRMTEEELRQAIAEPAELKKGCIQDELVDRLINDIKSQEDQLPILQHTLLWIWIQEEERREREGLGDEALIHLRLAEYEQLEPGRSDRNSERVRNALSRHGDTILKRLSPEGQRVAEVMFRRMVEVEEHSNRLRRPTRAGTVAGLAEVSLDVVQRVVDAFRADDASFIRVNQRRVSENTSIDIMHESLIRQWDTLDRWVRREKASYEVYDNLCRAAQRMHEGRGALLTGLELSHAQHWFYEEQPTRLWARRYGGDFDAARMLFHGQQ
jgi:energy-coupling factor transporter ATP-binding protein EcfA2